MSINLRDFFYKPLEAADEYSFDCGDNDLNEFFLKDAIPHKRELIGVTYFFYDEKEKSAIAFFTVSNDAIRTDNFKDELPEGKKYSFYPAVKIGRFGVNKKYFYLWIREQNFHPAPYPLLYVSYFFVHVVLVPFGLV